MALKFRNQITRLTQADLANAENSNRPHDELQANILYIYQNILFPLTHFVTSPQHYYVDGAVGDDGNDGTEDAPFASIGQAFSQANKIISDSRIVIHIEGGQTYTTAAINYHQSPTPIRTSGNDVGIVLKAESGTVTVDGASSIDSFLNLSGGNVFMDGTWVFSNFSGNAIDVRHSGCLTIRSGANVTFTNNTLGGICVSRNAALIVDSATVVGTGNGGTSINGGWDIDISHSVFYATSSSLGAIRVRENSYAYLLGSDILSGDSYPLVVTTNSAVKFKGVDSSNRATIAYDDSTTYPKIVVERNSTLDIGFVDFTLNATDYSIEVDYSAHIHIDDYLYFTGAGYGIYVSCSATWEGDHGTEYGDNIVSDVGINLVTNVDYSCSAANPLIQLAVRVANLQSPCFWRDVGHGVDSYNQGMGISYLPASQTGSYDKLCITLKVTDGYSTRYRYPGYYSDYAHTIDSHWGGMRFRLRNAGRFVSYSDAGVSWKGTFDIAGSAADPLPAGSNSVANDSIEWVSSGGDDNYDYCYVGINDTEPGDDMILNLAGITSKTILEIYCESTDGGDHRRENILTNLRLGSQSIHRWGIPETFSATSGHFTRWEAAGGDYPADWALIYLTTGKYLCSTNGLSWADVSDLAAF